MVEKASSEVEWSLVVEGEAIYQSNEILDCIEERGKLQQEARITDNA